MLTMETKVTTQHKPLGFSTRTHKKSPFARVKHNWLKLGAGVCYEMPKPFLSNSVALKNYRNFMMCYWSYTGRDYRKGVKVGLW